MQTVFVLTLLATPFLAFTLLSLHRRAAWRRVARRFAARHVDQGWFSPGRVEGGGFSISARPFGKSLATWIELDVPSAPGKFVLRPAFFGEVPDWRAATVEDVHRSARFLRLSQALSSVPPGSPLKVGLLAWIGREARSSEFRGALESARVREVHLGAGRVSARLPGVVTSPERLELALGSLLRLAPAREVESRRRAA